MVRSENRQIAINMVAQIVVFVIQFSISFFLTPFIVGKLGVEAYGFVGLSGNIIGYFQVASIALNSMAGRFISYEYHNGNVQKANRYFTSVFYSNCILCLVTSIVCVAIGYNLEHIINIPEVLVTDVKCLFMLLSVNTVLLLTFNVYTVVPYVKNRLEITAVRDLISKLIYAVLMVILFIAFTPYISFMGLASVISTIYMVIANVEVKRRLIPEFKLSLSNFDKRSVLDLLSSGIWNLLISMSSVIEKGFDLLLANLFIDATSMGMLSVVATFTVLIPKVVKTANNAFAPTITICGAKEDIDGIKRNVTKSIKIMALMVTLPLAVLYVNGDSFFKLWLPNQNSSLLYLITILTTIELISGLPLEVCGNIYGATNKVKMPAIAMFVTSIFTFLTLLLLLYIFKNPMAQLICLASTRSIWNSIRYLTFNPIYAAKCVNLPSKYIYKEACRPILGIVAILLICLSTRLLYCPTSWMAFFISSAVICVFVLFLGYVLILDHNNRVFIKGQMRAIYNRVAK